MNKERKVSHDILKTMINEQSTTSRYRTHSRELNNRFCSKQTAARKLEPRHREKLNENLNHTESDCPSDTKVPVTVTSPMTMSSSIPPPDKTIDWVKELEKGNEDCFKLVMSRKCKNLLNKPDSKSISLRKNNSKLIIKKQLYELNKKIKILNKFI